MRKCLLTSSLLHFCQTVRQNSGVSSLKENAKPSPKVGDGLPLRERFKKKIEKKLTNVSFAFTHTYTPVKLTFFVFFPKRTWKILKNVQKRKN